MTETKKRIPKFKTIKEEAEFWDTHDFTDYWEEFKPVKVKFTKNLSLGITVRFDTQTLRDLRIQASKKGIGPTTLIRMWVLEQLEKSHPKRSQSRNI